MERLHVVCKCHSLEHQVFFWYDEDNNELYCEPHLITSENFFQRLWAGLKYAFGYKSRYGHWDNTLFSDEDLKKLKDFLNEKAIS